MVINLLYIVANSCNCTGNGKSLVARRLSERLGPGHQRRILQLNDSDVCFGKITAAWLNQVTASVCSVLWTPVGPDRHHFWPWLWNRIRMNSP
jgi:hypothetical protein